MRETTQKFENKELVLVAAEEEAPGKIGRIRLPRNADRTGATLRQAVSLLIEAGARVRTDDWQGYARIDELGFTHQTVHYTASGSKNILPSVNRVASLLKRWLLGTHQVSTAQTHLDYYLDEFTFRFNRQTSRSRGLLFYRKFPAQN